jgi:hypothetical protein
MYSVISWRSIVTAWRKRLLLCDDTVLDTLCLSVSAETVYELKVQIYGSDSWPQSKIPKEEKLEICREYIRLNRISEYEYVNRTLNGCLIKQHHVEEEYKYSQSGKLISWTLGTVYINCNEGVPKKQWNTNKSMFKQ